MLKKVIVSILIPAFLIQIVGCYSNSEITINELKQHKKDEIKLVTKDSKEYSLFYDSKNKESNWELADSVIYVKTKKLEHYSPGLLVEKIDTTKVPLSYIKKLNKHSFNIIETTLLIATGIISVIYIVLATSGLKINLNNWSGDSW